MVISDHHKYLFISIPKCATHTIYRCLIDHFNGHRHGDFHNYEVPDQAREYFKFMCIRDPYDRAISAFHGIQQGKTLLWSNPIFADCADPQDMITLFTWAIEKGVQDVPTGWLRPQWHYIKYIDDQVDDKALFISQYNISENIKQLPFYSGQQFKLKSLNASVRDQWQNYVNPEICELIETMYAWDFENLGFAKYDATSH